MEKELKEDRSRRERGRGRGETERRGSGKGIEGTIDQGEREEEEEV